MSGSESQPGPEFVEATLAARIRKLSGPLPPEATGVDDQLSVLPGLRVVLFDIYGTLFVSASGEAGTAGAVDNAAALEEALASAGFSGDLGAAATKGVGLLLKEIRHEHQRLRRAGVQYPEVEIREIWTRVLQTFLSDGSLAGVVEEDTVGRLAVEYECRVNPVWPMPGALATLQALREKGVRLGVVSNAQFYTPLLFPALLGQSLEEIGFEPGLRAWSYRVREAKPSNRLFRDVLRVLTQELGLASRACLYVGNDMLNDVWAASRAGLRTALFAGDRRSLRRRETDERCAGLQPDVVVTELSQLLRVIGD